MLAEYPDQVSGKVAKTLSSFLKLHGITTSAEDLLAGYTSLRAD